jgi:SAM-dependent methyltransferase
MIGKMLNTLFPKHELDFLKFLEIKEDTRIMDVGCGSGRLLHFLGDQGMKYLLGVDPFIEKDIVLANGVHIQRATLQQQSGEWDILMFHHSFEHVPDPLETLSVAAKLLRPGGTCVISIPIVTEGAWKRYGVHWVQLDAPRHICLHSIQSLTLLGSRCDLEVTNIFFNSSEFQFWGSEQYKKGLPLLDPQTKTVRPNPALFSNSDMKRFRREARMLNRRSEGDCAFFFLKKPF